MPGRFRDRGQAAIEFLGFLPVLLLLALAGVQLGLGAYTAQQAGTAARAGARAAAQDQDSDRAARNAVSGWVADDARVRQRTDWQDVTVTTEVKIPSLVPGVDFGTATKSATMPRDRAKE